MDASHSNIIEKDQKLNDFVQDQSLNYTNLVGSDTDTWPSWPDSPHSNLVSGMDEYLSKMLLDKPEILVETAKVIPNNKKKRGRKPLRPLDPIKKKTEEKDKYWLRAFRAYMKKFYSHIEEKLSLEQKIF